MGKHNCRHIFVAKDLRNNYPYNILYVLYEAEFYEVPDNFYKAFESLSKKEQSYLLSYYKHGKGLKELAKINKVAISSPYNILKRALEKLKVSLEANDNSSRYILQKKELVNRSRIIYLKHYKDTNVMRIEYLGFCYRTTKCLRNHNLHTLYDLIGISISDLSKAPNFGKKSVENLIEVAGKYGLVLHCNDYFIMDGVYDSI